MTPKLWTIGAALVLSAGMTMAQQQPAFIQIEAQPSLSRAEDRVRDYASYLSNVNGFALGGGWYGIALGPFSPEEAAVRLSQLRSNGQIPRDSYVEEPDRYRSRFYPVGAGAIATPEPSPEPVEEPPETLDDAGMVALGQLLGTALYSGLLALPLGLLMVSTIGVWHFHAPSGRRATWR